MKLGLTQPYFFPYLGYFDLIFQTDQWIVFDSVQYVRCGWGNRNRVLHQDQGWQYIIVPLKKSAQTTRISDIEITDNGAWRQRILGQLQHYKKHAPYFRETISIIEQGLATETKSLARLNVNCLSLVCQYLGIRFSYQYFSDMHLDLGPITEPGDWALRVSEALGATEYVNPPGGVAFYDAGKFRAAGIKLTIRQLPPMQYKCQPYEFIPHLSILDLLMWNSAEEIRRHLEKYNEYAE